MSAPTRNLVPNLRGAVPKALAQSSQKQTYAKMMARLRTQLAQALAINARLQSIPKVVLPKEERFQRGLGTNLRFAARGQGYYDAFVQRADSMVLASQIGPCTAIEGHARAVVPGRGPLDLTKKYIIAGDGPGNEGALTGAELSLYAQDYTTLIVFNPGSSDHQVGAIYTLNSAGQHIEVQSTPLTAVAFAELGPTITNLTMDAESMKAENRHEYDPIGRIESIPVRGSLRIRNITENYSVGGEVRFLRYNGGIFLGSNSWNGAEWQRNHTMGVTEYLGICDMIRDSARTRVLDGAELRATHQTNTHPADAIRSLEFKQDTSFMEATDIPKFNTVLVLIDNFAAASGHNNTYSINCSVQRAARFRPGSILHNAARVPAANPDKHANHLKSEAATLLTKVAVGAATGGTPGAAHAAAQHIMERYTMGEL